MNKIPILDLKKQIAPIREELDAALRQVIDNTSFILGKDLDEFEAMAAQYAQVKYALGVSNGTDAIKLALIALGIKPGDAVACPAFTYYATAGAIASIGATPVFTDIDPDTYNISPASLEREMKIKKKKNIKAVIPVHLYGQCAEMDSILKLARRYHLKVVEDAAQAFGAEYKGSKAGSMGDCGAVSFFPAKNLGAFGDAGMVLTNKKAIAKKLRILRNQGNEKRYFHTLIGYNNRMDTLHAAVLKVKLKYLDSWNEERRKNAAYFNRLFAAAGIKIPFVCEYNKHIYHQYVLRISANNGKLMGYLRDKGIDSRVYYPVPLHLQKCFRYLGYKKGDFPESEKASRAVLAIPVYPGLSKEAMDYIFNCIKEFMHG